MTEAAETSLVPVPAVALNAYSSNPVPGLELMEQFVVSAGRAEIKTLADMEQGADLDRMLAGAIKKLDEERTGFVKPLNEVVNKINAKFKAPIKALKDARTTIQNKMTGFRAVEQRRLAEEQAAAQKKMEDAALAEAEKLDAQGKTEQAEAVIEDATELTAAPPGLAAMSGPVRGNYGGTASFIPVWTATIVDPDKVPREFCCPDERKIREAVKGPHGLREIAGCTIEESERMVGR